MSHKISKELFEAVMGFKTKSITIGNFQCTLGVKIPFTKKAIFITRIK